MYKKLDNSRRALGREHVSQFSTNQSIVADYLDGRALCLLDCEQSLFFNLQMIIQEYLTDINSATNINTSAEQVENIVITTAKRCLKIKTTRRHKHTYSRLCLQATKRF